jgi:hypothetical protein
MVLCQLFLELAMLIGVHSQKLAAWNIQNYRIVALAFVSKEFENESPKIRRIRK